MTSTIFGAASTTDEVLKGLDLSGKRILVTGVSAGLGVETARALVAHGASVVGAARDLAKARIATASVRDAAIAGGGSFELTELDLASLRSVRACADRLLTDGRYFHAVIANAGIMATPSQRTEDGFESQFGTNHLGHFVLINAIAPLIISGGRVVCLTSAGHRYADVNLADPNFEHSPYNPWVGYGRSKTANILFAVEFDRRHKGEGVRATAVHPGVIETELSRHMSPDEVVAVEANLDKANREAGLPAFAYKSIKQGAATSVWAAVVARADEIGGRYCEDCHAIEAPSGPEQRQGAQPYALDGEHAIDLWNKSEQMVGERF